MKTKLADIDSDSIDSEATLSAIMDHVPLKMAVQDSRGHYIYMNEGFKELLLALDTPSKDASDEITSCDGTKQALRAQNLEVLASGRKCENEIPVTDSTGNCIYHFTKFPIANLNSVDPNIGTICYEILERRKARQISRAKGHQPADLMGRTEFQQHIENALASSCEHKMEHVFSFIDVDHFKVINDICGHNAGDILLEELGEILRTTVRANDVIARIGGDEYGILLTESSLTESRQVANRILRAVQEYLFVWDEQEFHVSVSIGLVLLSESYDSFSEALGAADSACHIAKKNGRNRAHVFDLKDINLARHQSDMRWVRRIHRAVEENRLLLWCQSIGSIHASSSDGDMFEILLRMTDDKQKIVLPEIFLPVAEKYGLSTKLDSWVIESTLRWLNHSDRLDQSHLCFINLSAASLTDESFLRFVQECFRENQGLIKKICFEVTEAAVHSDLKKSLLFFNSLKKLGCRFAIDNFGSGYSSFAYLKSLPVEFLKIDGEYVKHIADDEIALAIFRSINEVGKAIGKKTIAEFVESEAVLDKLKELTVDYAQGYIIGYPTSIEERTHTQAEGELIGARPQ